MSEKRLVELPVRQIRPDPNQPRRTFNDASLMELSQTIQQHGVLQPVEVTEISPDLYMLHHGERRRNWPG